MRYCQQLSPHWSKLGPSLVTLACLDPLNTSLKKTKITDLYPLIVIFTKKIHVDVQGSLLIYFTDILQSSIRRVPLTCTKSLLHQRHPVASPYQLQVKPRQGRPLAQELDGGSGGSGRTRLEVKLGPDAALTSLFTQLRQVIQPPSGPLILLIPTRK